MKIYGISNVSAFLDRVMRCKGKVYSVESDGETRDLKATAGYLINSGIAGHLAGIREIDLDVEKPADVRMLMTYVCHAGGAL